jgi:chromosome partitioning protein
MSAYITAVVHHAGGVGKTTTVLNLGYSIAQRGYRVLLVDLDPQGDLSERLGLQPTAPSLGDALKTGRGVPLPVRCVWNEEAGIDVLPASLDDMAGVELALVQALQREQRVARVLAVYKEAYDFILLDCPPSLSLLTANALFAAGGVIIPVQAHAKAYRALNNVLTTIEDIQGYRDGWPQVWGFVITMREHTNAAAEVEAAVRAAYPGQVFATTIPKRTVLTVDSQYQAPIGVYAPQDASARAYAQLAEEVLARAQ